MAFRENDPGRSTSADAPLGTVVAEGMVTVSTGAPALSWVVTVQPEMSMVVGDRFVSRTNESPVLDPRSSSITNRDTPLPVRFADFDWPVVAVAVRVPV